MKRHTRSSSYRGEIITQDNSRAIRLRKRQARIEREQPKKDKCLNCEIDERLCKGDCKYERKETD